MNIETITKLIDAGYTKTEIDRMEAEVVKNEEVKNDEAKNEEVKTEVLKNEEVKTDDAMELIKTLTATVEGLSNTVKAMQDANAEGAQTKSATKGDAIMDTINSFIETL